MIIFIFNFASHELLLFVCFWPQMIELLRLRHLIINLPFYLKQMPQMVLVCIMVATQDKADGLGKKSIS